MKKAFALILTFLYLGIATGFSTYSHYCMDRYVETTFWQKDMGKCGICGMEKSNSKKKNCCKEEHKQVKLEKNHQAAEWAFQQFSPLATAILPTNYALHPSKALINLTVSHPVNNAPPYSGYPSLYVRHCTYLI
ncbi:HYC_CC_PP family protein [Olivibacter ginsenosidimutans]|uniref:HYC_CC_PP family protein n=1 Tax=Olivibacter ginsenosidimutans TaxID=1176537 RepID=UPI0031E55BC9